MAGRDQAHPGPGDGSSATEQLRSATLAWGKGGEGREETRITGKNRRGEEVGQAEEELHREEGAGEGGVQSGESPAAGAASPSPCQAANEDESPVPGSVRGCSGCRLPSGAAPQRLRG